MQIRKFTGISTSSNRFSDFISTIQGFLCTGSLRPTDIDRRAPGVYFRIERDLPTRTDKFGVEMCERLMWDIREGIVGAEKFIPKHSVIVTWKNMSFAGAIQKALHVTNTFQLVLATNEIFTYVIFNYADLQWTSHTEAGGDTASGEGGISAFVGFNDGNGTIEAMNIIRILSDLS
ncbi:hypothetical protein V9T40_005956 [Parthenolecanium corni]|uniref:NIDO domain-containing protein n=1 Tax=Parthenolecanium corni TaxID=536013 RepID=A0AAN9TTH8_9HEMI